MGFVLAVWGVRAVFASRVGAAVVLLLSMMAMAWWYTACGCAVGTVKVWAVLAGLFALRTVFKGKA